VRLVSAAPIGANPFAAPPNRPLIVASEYERITSEYMSARRVDYRYVRTYGATEVFPPEDADLIVDNVATGATLRANGLEVLDEILLSTTRMVAHRETWEDPKRREPLEQIVVLLRGVLDARRRVLLDMNVPADRLDAVVRLLPAMKSPTIQRLHGEAGYAVRAAVLREHVPLLLPEIRRAGATDILETAIQKVIA
jgi:ATP phosphoribosyltransferase